MLTKIIKNNKIMHDLMTVAFEINSPFKTKGYRNSLITIWHVDPQKDGTDDSCGWFLRPRHLNQNILNEIKSEFDFNFKHNYWFDQDGKQKFSTIGTLVQMYSAATWIHFNRNRMKQKKFMRKYLFDIINFAENNVDCIGDNITNKWNVENQEDRFNEMAGMIYSDICMKQRKWFQHPKWHIHHWRIQFNFLNFFKK
jgi:hypothetical protein